MPFVLVRKNLAKCKHCIAYTLRTGTERLAGFDAFQVLADSSAAFSLKLLQEFFRNPGRGYAIGQYTCYHHSADKSAAGALHTAEFTPAEMETFAAMMMDDDKGKIVPRYYRY